MSQIKELLSYTEEDKKKTRQFYYKSEEDVKSDVEKLLEWLEKQPHLPRPFDIVRVESFLLRNKFQIERTKKKYDNYYTYRGIYNQFVANMDPQCETIRSAKQSIIWVPLPKLLPTLERVIFFEFIDKQESIYDIVDAFSYVLMVLEIQLSYDYALVDRLVCDFKNITLKHITKMDPVNFSKAVKLHQEAMSGRLSFIDIINLPPSMEVVMNLFKRVLPGKLFQKMRVHANLESLHEVYPLDYLPKEYGGKQESIYVLHGKWGQELTYRRHFLLENAKKVSIEKLRVGDPIRSDLFGVDGTFKKINLD